MFILEISEVARKVIVKYFLPSMTLLAVILPVLAFVLPDLVRH